MSLQERKKARTEPIFLIPRQVGNFWLFQLGGWAAILLITLPFKLHLLSYEWGAVVLITIVRDVPAFLYTLWMAKVYRHSRRWLQGQMSLLIALIAAMSVLGAVADFVYVWFLAVRVGPEELRAPDFLTMTFFYRILIFGGWSLLYFSIREMLARQRQEEALREAEMQMLRAQINPHFFFNALNTIQAGAGRDGAALSGLVQNLAGYLRYVLRHRENLLVPLGEEYDAAIDYLAVEKARFCEGLELECFIDPATRNLQVPGVLIQPLLENAIKHGRRTSDPPLRLKLRVAMERGELTIRVTNNGSWISGEPADRAHGLGLENLTRRLRLCYPGADRLTVDLETLNEVSVILRLPPSGSALLRPRDEPLQPSF